MSKFITDYFDTNAGGKKESASYRKIAAALNFPAAEIIFVSDSAELDAAKPPDCGRFWQSAKETRHPTGEISIKSSKVLTKWNKN